MPFPQVVWTGKTKFKGSRIYRIVDRGPAAKIISEITGKPWQRFFVEHLTGPDRMGVNTWHHVNNIPEALNAISEAFGQFLVREPDVFIRHHQLSCELNTAIAEDRPARGCDCGSDSNPQVKSTFVKEGIRKFAKAYSKEIQPAVRDDKVTADPKEFDEVFVKIEAGEFAGSWARRTGDGKFAICQERLVKITNGEVLDPEMPIFILLARDNIAGEILNYYHKLSIRDQHTPWQLNMLSQAIVRFREWASFNRLKMKQAGITEGR